VIAGPGVFICERCVAAASEVLSSGERRETQLGPLFTVSAENARERCGFCGKRRREVDGLVSTGAVEICSDCVKLCDEILSERLA
jgi:ATP-dependent protease Clp ATPase subunit